MSGDITTSAIDISQAQEASWQLVFTGTAVGDFYVDMSADGSTWPALTLVPAPVAAGAGGNIGINLANMGFPWMRCRYVASTGTGTLDVFATVKNFS